MRQNYRNTKNNNNNVFLVDFLQNQGEKGTLPTFSVHGILLASMGGAWLAKRQPHDDAIVDGYAAQP